MPKPISNLEVKINNNNLNKKLNLQNEFKIFEHTVETQNFLNSTKEGQSGPQIPTVEEYIKSPVTMTLSSTLQKMSEKNVILDKISANVDTSYNKNDKNDVGPTENSYLNPRSFLLQYGYNIIKKIGEGTFSKVYSAVHILSNRTVAIKSLDKKKIMQNYALTERVFREITLLKSINHKNICQLLQLIDSPQYIHMVLEYESGGELYDEIVKKTRLAPEDCQVYFKQLVSAMEYCHNLGIVHRDLKPENILLDKHKKNVKIIDFGFSNLMKDNSNKLGTFCGSVAYAAPEVLSSRKYDGKKVDIWSLGIILYVMLVGQVPFKSRHVKILYESIVNKEYNIPDYVPNDARDLIEKMLVLEPEKRIEMDDILVHPWITNPIVTRRTSSGLGLMNIFDVKLANENEIIDKIIEICKNNNISENKIKINDENNNNIEQHDFDSEEFRESIINSINMDEPSSIKALYFLLKEEKAESLEKQMTKTWKMNSTLEVTKENDVTVYESIRENDNENEELSKKEKEIQEKENAISQKFIHIRQTGHAHGRRLSSGNPNMIMNSTTSTNANISITNDYGSVNQDTKNIVDSQGSEFIPRTPIDDNTTFMLLNAKYGNISGNDANTQRNYIKPPQLYDDGYSINSAYKAYGGNTLDNDFSNNNNAEINDTTTFSTLSPPVGELNTPLSAPPYQNNTKFVYEIPTNLSINSTKNEAPKNETLLEQIRRVKFNNNQPISAPVERTHYQPYLASFQYGIKKIDGNINEKVEDSMFKVQANTIFPPQLSKIACSSFNEFACAVCNYLESHHIKYTESVNYEGDESDIYYPYTSLDHSNNSIGMEEMDGDPMERSIQNRIVRTLIIDCYLKLDQEENENNNYNSSGNNGNNDMFIPNTLLESDSPTEAMEYLIEELSKQDRLTDGIHFQMTIENISVGHEINQMKENTSSMTTITPRTLYVRTLLDPTGVGPKEEKMFNDFIQDLVLSLK
jgi:serine/threonine protein kinase